MLRIITLALNNFNIWSNNLYKTKLILVLAEFLHKNNETTANKHHNMSRLFSDLYYKHSKSKYFYSFSMKQPAPQLPMHHVKNIVVPSIYQHSHQGLKMALFLVCILLQTLQ